MDSVAAFSVAQSPVQQQYYNGQHPYLAAFPQLAPDYTSQYSPYLNSGTEDHSLSLLQHTTDRWNELWSKMPDHDNAGSPPFTTSPDILSPESERSSGSSTTLLSPTGSPLDLRAERDLPRVTRTGSISEHSQHSVGEHHDLSPNVSRPFLPDVWLGCLLSSLLGIFVISSRFASHTRDHKLSFSSLPLVFLDVHVSIDSRSQHQSQRVSAHIPLIC